MKKITLFIISLSISLCSFSQVIVNLTSVPCNTGLEGLYQYTYAGELDGSSTDWNTPNMYDVNNVVFGPLVMIDDGTSGTAQDYITSGGIGPHPVPPLNPSIPASALGCDTLGNLSQDLSGKIAVVYRGTCNFSLKAYNAQKRGAIGVIIINHTGDPVFMGGAALGSSVTIPVVMVSRIAGDDLFLALQNCAGDTIIGFIGTKVGIYANDMGSSMRDILMPNELAKPWSLAQNGTEFPVDLGFWAFNYGTNNQNGVTANVDIQFNGSSVYNNTSAPLSFVAPSGILIDTQYFDLGTYAPSNLGSGTYLVTYTLNLSSADDDPTDNIYSYEYKLTNGDGEYAKSRINSTNQPISTKYLSLNESTTQYDDWEACIVFKDSRVGTRNMYTTGITFSCIPVGFDMDFEIVEVKLYEWNDLFVDIGSPPTYNSINQVAQGIYFYDYWSNGDLSGQNIYVPFDVPSMLANNQRYLFCVYTASDSIKLGFDEKINYKTTINHYQQPIAPLKILPDGGSSIWDWEGFGVNVIPAISVRIEYTTSVEKELIVKEIVPYPNPSTNLLTIPIRKNVVGNVLVEVFDLAGKLILSENKIIGNEPLKVNVASIKNGTYVFNLTFADNTKEVFKISVNR